MIEQRYRDEFEQLGPQDVRRRVQGVVWNQEKHVQAEAWLKEQDGSMARELASEQMSIAHVANEIARLASKAATDAAEAARSQARTAKAALIIATIALAVSIITPEKLMSYYSSKPWLSWFSSLK